jgi:hypothetical protein
MSILEELKPNASVRRILLRDLDTAGNAQGHGERMRGILL